jgi:hypothetical protein
MFARSTNQLATAFRGERPSRLARFADAVCPATIVRLALVLSVFAASVGVIGIETGSGDSTKQIATVVQPIPAPVVTRREVARPVKKPSVPGIFLGQKSEIVSVALQPSGEGTLFVNTEGFADDFMARTRVGRRQWTALVEDAAKKNNLPVDFFSRLLAQESNFNPTIVSHAGALGIAQFMPGTAVEVGLRDPFDPAEAIPAAAKHIAALRARFGNVGLAAAAYNAGPDRVTAWLSGRKELPRETTDYVRTVTGVDAEDWAPSRVAGLSQPSTASMSQHMPKLLAISAGVNRKLRKSPEATLCESLSTAKTPCLVQQHY